LPAGPPTFRHDIPANARIPGVRSPHRRAIARAPEGTHIALSRARPGNRRGATFSVIANLQGEWRGTYRVTSCTDDQSFRLADSCREVAAAEAVIPTRLAMNQAGAGVTGTIDFDGPAGTVTGPSNVNQVSLAGSFSSLVEGVPLTIALDRWILTVSGDSRTMSSAAPQLVFTSAAPTMTESRRGPATNARLRSSRTRMAWGRTIMASFSSTARGTRSLFFVLTVISIGAAGLPARHQPAASPAYDIAFAALKGSGIHVMRGDGTQPRLIASDQSAVLVPGSWSPDGRRIAHFGANADDLKALAERPLLPLHFPLHVVNADGTGHERLIDVPVEPFLAWSPDSTRLAFSSGFEDPRAREPRVQKGLEGYSSAIYVLEIQSRRFTRLTPSGNDRHASWAPDGRRIVFSRDEGPADRDIYIVDAAGATPRRVVAAPTVDGHPAWSPVGDRIAFVAAPKPSNLSDRGVYVTAPDGSGTQRVCEESGQTVSWSRDGRYLLVAGPGRLIDMTTHTAIDLGTGMMDPVFAPDGSGVIYRAFGGGAPGIHAVGLDGAKRRRLGEASTAVGTFAVSPLIR
jgi:Tol biopolymer transport system component